MVTVAGGPGSIPVHNLSRGLNGYGTHQIWHVVTCGGKWAQDPSAWIALGRRSSTCCIYSKSVRLSWTIHFFPRKSHTHLVDQSIFQSPAFLHFQLSTRIPPHTFRYFQSLFWCSNTDSSKCFLSVQAFEHVEIRPNPKYLGSSWTFWR